MTPPLVDVRKPQAHPQQSTTATSLVSVLLLLLAVLSPAAALSAADDTIVVPSPDFHALSCPPLQAIVRCSVQAALQKEIALAAGVLRIFFHDCFPQGCDASILLKKATNVKSELDEPPNKTIQQRALQLIDDVRAKVHAACGQTVSCTDITALVTRDVVVLSGGPSFDVLQGKLDSFTPASQDDVFSLPGPNNGNVTSLVEIFATRGLADHADLVALSGAHTIGRSECDSFSDRSDRRDDTFSKKLALNCTKDHNRLQNLDVITPDLFDNGYYKALTFNQGVFTSDMALIKDRTTARIVKQYAQSKDAFFAQFAKSMEKLSNAPRPAGNVGEIRSSCFSRNAPRVIETAADDEEGLAASA